MTIFDIDAHTVLEALRSKYKIGIIANQELGCNERLEKMGIAHFFDWRIRSSKEEPDITVGALSELLNIFM